MDKINAKNPRILIAGDIMLDRYWFGEVNRISPEAPVPVVLIGRHEERLGGAANVARNVAALGNACSLLGIVGKDEAGLTVEKMLRQSGIAPYLHSSTEVSTTVKLRVIGRQQQLLRLDFEKKPTHEVLEDKLRQYRSLLATHDIVVLSDYGKGALDHVASLIAEAKKAGKTTLIDPKGDDFSKYKGATLLTPNKSELREVVGSWKDEAELTAKAQALRKTLDLDYLLLTRSEEGMSLYGADEVLHIPTVAREVFDVSGAGDTVIATLAAMIGSGKTVAEAVHVANRAAGIVVGKLGTATVTSEELFPS
ncbi:D-glycero-beta-D-manno-heptose-7-phosphate kinase [Oxalobacter paraformigenes]|uniref:RfaE, domain I n=1 Tax=Oxalobacter paraformigenes TaxID=556268 RepID=C3X5F2_9BURK|nr:D-glycero-beta-D-manno-heptose-7-phosphate kinase [Oxalobacter paraformigenes]EEO28438.1 RfaE, domain I [Oxalobacter paraformigenes]